MIGREANYFTNSEKTESNWDKLVKLVVNQYGAAVDLRYACQKRSFYISDTEIHTKYDCHVTFESFSFCSKSNVSENLAREQAAFVALEFLKRYKSCAIDLNLMKPTQKLKNIFRFPSVSLREQANKFRKETTALGSNDAGCSVSKNAPHLEEIEGNPVDILQKIASESSLELFYSIVECGPVFKIDCKIGDQVFQAFNQSKRTAKKLVALKALENIRPNIKVIDSGGYSSLDMNLVHNFCQKNPFVAEYTCKPNGANYTCNFKLISEDTKECIIDLNSKEFPTKRDAKRDACQLALKEMKKKILIL